MHAQRSSSLPDEPDTNTAEFLDPSMLPFMQRRAVFEPGTQDRGFLTDELGNPKESQSLVCSSDFGFDSGLLKDELGNPKDLRCPVGG